MKYDTETVNFIVSVSWVNKFKHDHRITIRAVTRCLKPSGQRSIEELHRIVAKFQAECATLMTSFNPDFVISTDQMGNAYRIDVKRTLHHKGAKSVELYLGDLNKVTYSYTAQYTITSSGKFINKVFICLQEPTGKFGPRIHEEVNFLTQEYKNVYICCSKSGELSTQLFNEYLEESLKPYVKEEKFLLLLDSLGGQAKDELYEKFVDSVGNPTCTKRIIPAGSTAYAQPLDVYIHRKLKILIKAFQNFTYLLQHKCQINTRSDAIKIQSLVLNQLSAPIFRDTVQYSWYAAKLTQDRDIFSNVQSVCFPKELSKEKLCIMELREETALIKCAWRRESYCFPCFYDRYHPKTCQIDFTNVQNCK